MIDERKNLFFCLNVAVQICAEHSFLANCFECIKLIFSFLLYEVHFSESSLSDSFIKFEATESDGLHFVVFFDELIQFENIFLAIADNFDCLFFLVFLLAVGFSCFIFLGRSMMEHSFDHGSVG